MVLTPTSALTEMPTSALNVSLLSFSTRIVTVSEGGT